MKVVQPQPESKFHAADNTQVTIVELEVLGAHIPESLR